MKEHELGSQPIEPEFRMLMNTLAHGLQEIFNGEGTPISESKVGWILMAFNLEEGDGHRTNYISNCKRADVLVLLKEQVKYFEGQPEVKGKA